MKHLPILFLVGLCLLSCKKDEETVEPTPKTTETEAVTQMVVVVGGDTLRTDSVYTRTSASGGYQISAVDSLGRIVSLKIFDFQGEASYPTVVIDPFNEFLKNSIELIDYDGASWLNFSNPEGFINVTAYSEETQSVSGSFGGPLQNTDGSGETLTIDTAYFENVLPMVLNTAPGKADIFNGARLIRSWETTAALSASHHLQIQTVEDPYGDGFAVWVNDATPTTVTLVYFNYGPGCYPVDDFFDVLPLEVDYANQTVSGEIRNPLTATYIYLNEVPVAFPEFPIPSDQLNFYYNGDVITFEEYSIVSTAGTGNQVVTFSAWSSSGAYLEGSLTNDWFEDPWTCGSLYFTGSMSLYENENSPVPLATFQGQGNLASTVPATLADMGFFGDEAELGGINLEVTFVE